MDEPTYTAPEIPADEKARLEELYGLNLLDAASERRFDHFTSLVAEIFNFPIVSVTFVDHDRQWFKSSCGLSILETNRDVSFCAHAIYHEGVMVVPDTHQDSRFAGNPLVIGPPHIRFYASATVRGPQGSALGTLCTIDRVAREFTADQCRQLRQFANLIESEIRHGYDLELLRSSLQFDAYFDKLTRLPNRHLLSICLNKLTDLVQREDGKAAVLLFNLPDLHLLKQSLGSDTVNCILAAVAERLNELCPAGGTVARLEEDTFALVFAVFSDEATQIDRVVAEARHALNTPFTSDNTHYLRVRIGGSVSPDDGSIPAELVERALAALRFSASDGHSDTRFFDESESLTINERLQIESRLRGAIANNHLSLDYQPIISLCDGTLAGVEALLRWHDPELGQVPPDRFIPVAERTGLILAVGQWVQQEACRQLNQWCSHGPWDIPVAINVAAAELLQPSFAPTLLAQLEAAEIAPHLLCIEVTECSQLIDSVQADDNIRLLSEASVHINIDDFGTGYSSLDYLRRMPFRKLKIDRSFMRGLPSEKREVTLVQTILSMAGALSLDTVAEGVENQDQLDYLRGTHCGFVQGFYLSRPLAPAEIPALREHAWV